MIIIVWGMRSLIFVGANCIVDKPVYDNGRVYINKTQYFDTVPKSAWDFCIGGYNSHKNT